MPPVSCASYYQGSTSCSRFLTLYFLLLLLVKTRINIFILGLSILLCLAIQMVKRATVNRVILGSIPAPFNNFFFLALVFSLRRALFSEHAYKNRHALWVQHHSPLVRSIAGVQ